MLFRSNLLDALITAAAESESVKINKNLSDDLDALTTSRSRTLDVTNSQVSRTSDAISLKRGELLRILRLCKSKATTGDTATQMHYDDMALRIQTALGL